MLYQTLGKTGWKVSKAALGGWAPDRSVWSAEHDALFQRGVDIALEEGINFFDTAECYGDGYSETLLGKALGGRRKDVYIASKVWYDHLKKEDTIQACENSLKRLGTDYLDVYYIHYPDPKGIIPVEETMEAMLSLKERGLIRTIGVSNFTLEQMKRVCAMGRVDVIQPGYSLLWRTIDKEIKPYCLENEISIVPYSPTATGILTGKYDKSFKLPENDDRAGTFLYEEKYFPVCVELADKLKPVAAKYEVTCGQLAINWLNYQEGITSILMGGKTPEQIQQNINSFMFEIEKDDLTYLDEISREATEKLPYWTAFFRDLGLPMEK